MKKNSFLITTLTLILFACNSQTERQPSNLNSADNLTDTLINREPVRFFPDTKGVEKFDTLIIDQQLQVTIIKTDLDSYVKFEYDIDGKKQIDKYRDAEINLTIKQNSQTLLDTIFRKKQFLKYMDKAFIDVATFNDYSFKKLDKDKIELFGVLGKPETDYTFAFYHSFDLKDRKLSYIEYVDDEQ